MSGPDKNIVNAYSSSADEYAGDANVTSCWGTVGDAAGDSIEPDERCKVIAEIGCGTGAVLERLATRLPADRQFTGIEPAAGMREQALSRLTGFSNVAVGDGSFESLPFGDHSVDYLYSINAFHWTTDVEGSVNELARVLKPSASMDLYFAGRGSGKEFSKVTGPIFLRYLGFRRFLESAERRQRMTLEEVRRVFGEAFPLRLTVSESFETHYDSLEGHMGWWVRIRGHFDDIEPENRKACERETWDAIASLESADGIPYTVHLLHVRLESE